jgi:hypothetical protein
MVQDPEREEHRNRVRRLWRSQRTSGRQPRDNAERYRSTVREFPLDGADDEDDDNGAGVRIVEERSPLREDKIFVDFSCPSAGRFLSAYREYELSALSRAGPRRILQNTIGGTAGWVWLFDRRRVPR